MESLPIPSPDYTSLKESLKSWLKNQPELIDYNFDGSTLNMLLGVMGYNTTMNAFHLNQVANEAFLTTVSRRENAVLGAQSIGYDVTTRTSSRAIVRLTAVETVPTSNITLTLPPTSLVFSASIGDNSYTFRSLVPVTLTKLSSGSYVGDVTIFEGKQFNQTIQLTANHISDGIKLQNTGIDSSTIKLAINGYNYSKINNIVGEYDNTSRVFFVREVYNNLVVEFGDGIIGRKPLVGESITISYLKSSGSEPNNIGSFKLVGSIAGVTTSLSVVSAAYGGANEETIDSIKYNAPLWYQSQGRAVTVNDYKVVARKLFNGVIDDVMVWGGEDSVPPVYGRVMLSIKPTNGYYFTSTQKSNMIATLKKYNVVTITPVIVDPDYVYIDVVGSFEYIGANTSTNENGMSNIVKSAVSAFAKNNLGKFENNLRYSSVSSAIFNSDAAITSTQFKYRLSKHIAPVLGAYNDLSINFINPLIPNTFTSSTFTFNSSTNCKFIDDGVGYIKLVDYSTATPNVIKNKVGTIAYDTGLVTINRTYIVDADRTLVESTGTVYIKFTATSSDVDLNAVRNNILIVTDTLMSAIKV